VDQKTELVGGGLAARGAVGGEVQLVRLDQVLGLASGTIELLVERFRQARQIGDDEPAVGPLRAGLDAGDDAALDVPALGGVAEIGRVEVWRGSGSPSISVFPPLSSGGALPVRTWLRFHTPLIEPDMRIARIRLSDKTSRHRPRRAAPKPGQTYEPEEPVEMREWISPASASPDLVFGPQPPTQPHSRVVVERARG